MMRSSSLSWRSAVVKQCCNRCYSTFHTPSFQHHEQKNLSRRQYFTNTDLMKRDDPYFQLGLAWGATSTEIKDAFRKRSLQLHPDVNKEDTPDEARRKFQLLQKAYATLMGEKSANDDVVDKWRFAVWRKGDIIAEHRTDVAGVMRKRPAKPAGSDKAWNAMQLGHPDGRGVTTTGRAEYLGDGSKAPRSSSVGRGLNKWVAPKEYKQWEPNAANLKRAEQPVPNDDVPSDGAKS